MSSSVRVACAEKKKEKEEQIKLGNHYVVNKEFYSPRGSSLSLPNKTILLSPTKEPEQMDKTILFGFWATTTAEKIRDLSESIVKMQLKDGSIARDVEYIIDVAKIERTISLAKQMKKIEEFKKSMDVIVEKIKEEEKLSTDKRIYIVNNHNYYSPRGSELSCPDGVVFFSVAKEIENISKKDMLEFWANTSTEKIKLLFEKLILNGLEVGLLKKNIAYAIDLENIEKTITAAMQMSATSSSSFSAGSSSSACSSSSSSSNSEDEPEDEQDEDKECNYNYRKIFEGADNGIIDGLVEEGIIGGIMGALNGAVEGGLEALDEKCLCENKSKLPPETKSALRKFAITTIFSHHKGKKLLKELTTQSIVGYMSEKLGLKIDTSPNEDSSLNCNIIAKQIVEDVLNNAMIATMLTRNIRVVAGASIVGVFTGTLKGLNKAVYQAQQYKKEKEHENSPPKARPF